MLHSDNPLSFLSLLTYPVELRIPDATSPDDGRYLKTVSGYFDNHKDLQSACEYWSGHAPAIYITLNPVNPDLLCRSHNKWIKYAKATTTDADITKRVWLPIDIDAKRPSGISASDAEHDGAIGRMRDVLAFLTDAGFPSCVFADSGNGAHALFRIDEPNTPEVGELIHSFLEVLAKLFNNDAYTIDTTVSNAARIWKAYGTKVCKGDEVGDRQHRTACILEQPDTLPVLSLDLVREFVAQHKPPVAGRSTASNSGGSETVDTDADAQARSLQWVYRFLDKHNIEHGREHIGSREQIVVDLVCCPFCEESDHKQAVTVETDGTKGYNCFHNRCVDKHWSDFRKHYDESTASVDVGAELDKMFSASTDGDSGTTERPTILCNGRAMSDVFDDAEDAIRKSNNPPKLFVRCKRLTRLRTDMDNGAPYFEPLEDGGLIDIVNRAADWMRNEKVAGTNGKDFVKVFCNVPEPVIRYLKSNPDCGLPAVKTIIETPVFSRSGELITAPGYHAGAKIWLHDHKLNLPAITSKPTKANIEKAKQLLLDELLVDFPFEEDDNASRCHALAMLLLPFVRPMIDGPTPLHAINAPTAGTGKSLLARQFSIVATGRQETAMSAGTDEADWGKRITSALMGGPVFILWDNVSKPLNSASLAMALTTPIYKDRLLTTNKVPELPVENVWLATGNGLHASVEISRRMLWIGLDANSERPEQREGFRHADIARWCKEQRADLVWACLTLCQAWVAAGRQKGTQVMGSYEAYSETLGGILSVAGVDGFLENRHKLFTEANTSDMEWRDFVQAMVGQRMSNPFGAKEAVEVARERGLFASMLLDAKDPYIKMGFMLGDHLNKVSAGWKLLRATDDSHANAKRYRFTHIEPNGGRTEPNMTNIGGHATDVSPIVAAPSPTVVKPKFGPHFDKWLTEDEKRAAESNA